ncbi:hypothetical protein BGX33_000192 [Mortierella sp. NVP41]|nr:hypothetical protein BGX33_000192 [Mortierella sp. NVP41]
MNARRGVWLHGMYKAFLTEHKFIFDTVKKQHIDDLLFMFISIATARISPLSKSKKTPTPPKKTTFRTISLSSIQFLHTLPVSFLASLAHFPTIAPTSVPILPSSIPIPILRHGSQLLNISKLLRAGNQPSLIAPNTKHTKNVQANHELDSIQAIWDILQDTTSGYTDAQRCLNIETHLRQRAATLQIGATIGWHAVPGSELQTSLVTMGLTQEVAQNIASTNHQQSFRSSHHKSSGGRKSGRGKKSKA